MYSTIEYYNAWFSKYFTSLSHCQMIKTFEQDVLVFQLNGIEKIFAFYTVSTSSEWYWNILYTLILFEILNLAFFNYTDQKGERL
jgi:hypothetical protein